MGRVAARGGERRWFDAASKALRKRETRTVVPEGVEVLVEQNGEIVQNFVATPDGVAAAARPNALGLFDDEYEFCGQERDARYGKYLFVVADRMAKCLEKVGRGDIANEVMYAATHATIQCGEQSGDIAFAPDAGEEARSGRIVIVTSSMDTFKESTQSEVIGHELLHYTSLGLHDGAHTGDDNSRMDEGDPVYACAELCASETNIITTKCHCATCLDVDVCDKRCEKLNPCINADLGAICPCKWNRKWYPTYEQCVADCSSGLLCFGHQKCRSLNRECG